MAKALLLCSIFNQGDAETLKQGFRKKVILFEVPRPSSTLALSNHASKFQILNHTEELFLRYMYYSDSDNILDRL